MRAWLAHIHAPKMDRGLGLTTCGIEGIHMGYDEFIFDSGMEVFTDGSALDAASRKRWC